MRKYYAGIGARSTPLHVLKKMTDLAVILENKGFILRSGGADGADKAFESGVSDPANKEIFKSKYRALPEAEEIASKIHPAWHNCSEYARQCHARNVHQILGEDLMTPVEFVVCWTPNGEPVGGTRTGILLAESRNIPVINLGKENLQYEFIFK